MNKRTNAVVIGRAVNLRVVIVAIRSVIRSVVRGSAACIVYGHISGNIIEGTTLDVEIVSTFEERHDADGWEMVR